MHDLAHRVCRYVSEQGLLRPGDRVGVAVSGGADSVALLRLLLELREELGLVLSVVHVNHRIRGAEADTDQQFVNDLAQGHGLPVHTTSADTPAYAAQHRLSLEAAARELRYRYFQQLPGQGILNKVATAHTLDDQAETVLLRLVRGTGITGLAGIYPMWSLATGRRPGHEERGALARAGERSSPFAVAAIVRPLLSVRRGELLAYLQGLSQPWREDASNLDLRFSRNRVRHKLLPLLESELNPRVRERLAETAEIARAEEDYWAAEISGILAQVWTASAKGGQATLQIATLRQHPLALQRRLVRAAAESLRLQLDFQHIEELLALAQAPPAGEKQVILPEGWRVRRIHERLQFEPPDAVQALQNHDFAYSLTLPGEVAVPETGTVFRAIVGALSPAQAGRAYDPNRLPGLLQVRNWHPGDRFSPAHSRGRKKIKELLQDRKIPLAQRRTWPVITSAVRGQEEVIWVRGFLPPEHLLAAAGQAEGLMIEESALQGATHRAE